MLTEFKYTAATKDNIVMKGKIAAATEAEAMTTLKEMGYYVINLKQPNILATLLSKEIRFSKTLSGDDLAFFCRHMYFFINTGVSLADIKPTAPNKALTREFENIRIKVFNGESISQAVQEGPFPPLLHSMIQIGENTGQLGSILSEMEEHYTKQSASQKEIINMLIYPAFTLIAMLSVIVITMIHLVPSFAQMFAAQNMTLPTVTNALISVSNFFVNGGAFLLLIPIMAVTALLKSQKLDKLFFYLPIIKRYFIIAVSARFSSSMAIMLKAGVTMHSAVGACGGLLKNLYYKNIIKNMHDDINQGQSLGSLLGNSFHPILISMVQLGESTGTLPETMEKCSHFFEKEQAIAFARLKRLVEPSITIVMGLMLIFIMLAIMLPTFELTGAL